MKIVFNDEFREALEFTCGCVKDYRVDVTIHLYADGDVEVSVTPTYRDVFEQPKGEE